MVVLSPARATDEIVGEVRSIINWVTDSVLEALPAPSVTIMVTSLYVPSTSVLKVIVLFPSVAAVVVELALPLYVIVPASLVLNT